jgi:hypothetical protein
MTATRYNVPPSSTLVITVLVPRTSPSSNLLCTARAPPGSSFGAQSVHPTSCDFREFVF